MKKKKLLETKSSTKRKEKLKLKVYPIFSFTYTNTVGAPQFLLKYFTENSLLKLNF